MNKIKILLAESNYLTRRGIKSLLAESADLQLVAEAQNQEELIEKIKLFQPDLLIIDYFSAAFKFENIQQLIKKDRKFKTLAITSLQTKNTITKALESGVISYLLKECDEAEIMEAIYKAAKGEKFLCGKVLDVILNDDKEAFNFPSYSSCEGINITDREMEIIKLIAEGYANKQIADKLFLSTHTVTTHRKNIMSKLDINNTAGIVLYAVRENLISPNKYLFSSEN